MMKSSKRGLLNWRSLRHRPFLAGTIFGLSQVVALLCWFWLPHQYLAQAVVLIDSGAAPTRLAINDERANLLMGKVNLLMSSLLAEEVVRTTGLDRSEVMRDAWAKNARSGLPYEQWLQSIAMAGIVPDASPGSLVLKVGYVSTLPDMARLMANAYADALVQVSDLLNKGSDRFADQAFTAAQTRARAELSAAQESMRQGAGADLMAEGISDPALRAFLTGTRQTTAFVRLHLESQAQQRIIEGRGDPGSLLDDAFLRGQRQKLSDLKGQRAEATTNFGDGHPVLKALDASIASVEAAIQVHEGKRRLASAMGVQTRADVARSVGDSDAKVQAALLNRERRRLAQDASRQAVDGAGERYEDALTNAEIAVLNRDAPRADVRLMSAAVTPVETWFPRLGYYVPVALVLGLLLAWLGVGIVERVDPRVRGADELADALGTEWTGRLS
ncbi:MAG: hypothetical protein WAP57_10195 [Aquabacterium commune]|uniref:hypothetical protein n=1 Tax=Aquabacterium commune TaxID=70586 RepID=UPI003BAE3FF2